MLDPRLGRQPYKSKMPQQEADEAADETVFNVFFLLQCDWLQYVLSRKSDQSYRN
jgi:hypothetical protein